MAFDSKERGKLIPISFLKHSKANNNINNKNPIQKRGRFQGAHDVSAGLWDFFEDKTESGVRLFRCYITVRFITGNWVVFLWVTTWLSKLNITNKVRLLCPFSCSGRRIRHFLRRNNWLTAMIITEALSASLFLLCWTHTNPNPFTEPASLLPAAQIT